MTPMPLLDFLRALLKGFAQVFFMNNALTGLFFLIAIGVACQASGDWGPFWGSLVGGASATLTALVIDRAKDPLHTGMYGFNGVLLGVALPTFLQGDGLMWGLIVLGAAMTTIIVDALSNVLTKTWDVAVSTGPFVLTTWLLLFSVAAFDGLHFIAPVSDTLAVPQAARWADLDALLALQVTLRNISQVFLLNNAWSGLLILLGVAVASRGGALAAWLGALLALVCATVLGADRQTVQSGLYGFSAVLSAMAVAVVFIEPSPRSALVGGLAVVFTVIIQGALNHWLAPYGVPSLTAAYLIAMWLFTLPKMDLLIHPHQPNRSSSFGRN
ncbi:urea transporter [Curvibacter sp. HBC61]|uniref:Urea transporter n=1 Tax=Curvibacter cyanobacteriorum TaxID=3026422 RepID=A0ABT5N3I5_9BURK|nr:urea transporter [Curvibacter sp. HBC61]MDD0840680.1 urea transporter [Curvibacter sp. HBC61]